jgi:hypothetical protein
MQGNTHLQSSYRPHTTASTARSTCTYVRTRVQFVVKVSIRVVSAQCMLPRLPYRLLQYASHGQQPGQRPGTPRLSEPLCGQGKHTSGQRGTVCCSGGRELTLCGSTVVEHQSQHTTVVERERATLVLTGTSHYCSFDGLDRATDDFQLLIEHTREGRPLSPTHHPRFTRFRRTHRRQK